MKMSAVVFLIVSVSLLSGCATPKQWVAVGGSRSDGTVKLAFEYGLFEKPELQPGQGTRLATQKCGAWGYSGAESFGSTTSQCVAWNNSGCLRWRIFAEFQCTSGAVVKPIPPTIEPIGPRVSEKAPE